jgi:hypothetical protein
MKNNPCPQCYAAGFLCLKIKMPAINRHSQNKLNKLNKPNFYCNTWSADAQSSNTRNTHPSNTLPTMASLNTVLATAGED